MTAPRLGILGGTFDPPHLGHLLLAETALDSFGLARMLLVPAASPPHKRTSQITPVEHRLAMLKLAISGNPRLEISSVDMDRPAPHYTVDMLSILHEQYPDADLYFTMGDDSLTDFLTWYDPAGIIARARLVVMCRKDQTPDLTAMEAALPQSKGRVLFIPDAPGIGISSTKLRDRIRDGLSVRYQIPHLVEAYIRENHLYMKES